MTGQDKLLRIVPTYPLFETSVPKSAQSTKCGNKAYNFIPVFFILYQSSAKYR